MWGRGVVIVLWLYIYFDLLIFFLSWNHRLRRVVGMFCMNMLIFINFLLYLEAGLKCL